MAVLTGIDNQLAQGACNYIGYRSGVYKADADPADNYPNLPQACRIANGLGVCVMLATISMFVAVGLRNYSPAIFVKTDHSDDEPVIVFVQDKLEDHRHMYART